jgi:lysophospholipase L1-like esterase
VRRVFLWFVPAGLGIATAAILAAGFAAGMSGRLGQPIGDAPTLAPTPTPAAAASAGAFRLVALGDSLTRGTGDMETGGGYPERVAAAIRKSGRSVVVENLGVDGSETEDLLRKVKDPEVQRRIASASLILFSIGGNDLTHSLEGGRGSGTAGSASGAPGSDPTAAALSRISINLLSILSSLRSLNPTAPIRLLGLYNPFPDATSDQHIARETLLKWNVALEEASYSVPNALVVPTADLFEGRSDRLSSDRFHPGPPGYDEIATRVVSTLRTAAPAAPAAPAAAAASKRQSGG